MILVLGDSLGASYGVTTGQGWVALLQERIRSAGYPHRVVNASISGETTGGGLARLPAALDRERPQIVLIELGGNDGLRGLPVKVLRDNLDAMATLAKQAGARPVIFEMRVPSNYGEAYSDAFGKAFGEVARRHDAPLVPFFLLPIAFDRDAFQDDGIHPTAAAQPRLLDAAWPTLKPLLDGVGRAAASVPAPAS